MKISCNVKQGTSLVKNSSQTVEIKDKTNEKNPHLEQNISNHKLDRSAKKLIPILHQTYLYMLSMPTNTKQQLCIKPTGFLVYFSTQIHRV